MRPRGILVHKTKHNTEHYMNYTSASIKALTLNVLKGFGCDDSEAEIVASHLLLANLSGHDSHGIGMLPMYGEQVLDGNLVPNQTPQLNEPQGAISTVDAKRGFGHRMAVVALEHAMKTIPEHKVAILGMHNSGHVSRIGTYSEYCASRGYVSLHFVNVLGHKPIVAPYGAREAGFSTNPVSIGMPVNNKAHPMLDMATSTVAFGKARVAYNKGEKLPPGCMIDAEGVPTIDPQPMVENRDGCLSAFGNHKGSGLGIFVELLAGALAGDATIATAETIPRGAINNMFSIIVDPAGFDSAKAVEQRTIDFYDFIKARQPAKGSDDVLMPGEPEIANRAEREANGVPVDDETIRQIIEIGGEFKVDKSQLEGILVSV